MICRFTTTALSGADLPEYVEWDSDSRAVVHIVDDCEQVVLASTYSYMRAAHLARVALTARESVVGRPGEYLYTYQHVSPHGLTWSTPLTLVDLVRDVHAQEHHGVTVYSVKAVMREQPDTTELEAVEST